MQNSDGSFITGIPIWKGKITNSFSLTLYPIMLLLGVMAFILTVYFFWKRYKYPTNHLQYMFFISVPLGIISARIYDLISQGKTADWSSFFSFKGLSIYGTIIGVAVFVSIYLWVMRHKLDGRNILGFVLSAILIGQSVGRWGNFTNHELYGSVVSEDSLNWLLPFIKKHMFIDGYFREPLFLYEAIATFIGYLFLVWIILNFGFVKPGVGTGMYLSYYGIVRASLEHLRHQNDVQKYLIPGTNIRINFLISILLIIAGIILMIIFQLNVSGKPIRIKIDSKDQAEPKYLVLFPEKKYRAVKKAFVYPKLIKENHKLKLKRVASTVKYHFYELITPLPPVFNIKKKEPKKTSTEDGDKNNSK